MKIARILAAVPFLLLSANASPSAPDASRASECAFNNLVEYDAVYEEAVESAISNLEQYNELCAFLEARDLYVDLRGTSGILEERAYAWALVTLAHRETNAAAGGHQTVTLLGTPADSVEERRALFAVMKEALRIVAENPARLVSTDYADNFVSRHSTLPKN